MAMTSTLTQSQTAQMGMPTNFVVAITNGGAGTVVVKSVTPTVTRPDGVRFDACAISPLMASPSLSSALVGASQFNVSVTAGATVYFSFSVCFFGPAISGGPTAPNMQFLVDCFCSYDDATSSGCLSAKLVNLNQPQFGPAPGAPPNPAPAIGQLDFQTPASSALAL